mmetsp:Transcript_8157/g.20989  ORF Transcript_8157/g.20989 Transcript_8157/m.20989 type:complete len:151 (+) Transcript_8157:268-720(+)
MWAFTLACSQQSAGPVTFAMHPEFMLQPPWDKVAQVNACQYTQDGKCHTLDGFILHYTYGIDFDAHGESTPGKMGAWRFDKRSFVAKYPTLAAVPMPTHENIRREYPLTYELVRMIREAIPYLRDATASTPAVPRNANKRRTKRRRKRKP